MTDPACTCGAVIDGTAEEIAEWLELHIEAARRRGDEFWHAGVPF